MLDLAAQHLGLLHEVARRMASYLSDQVELDDLVSWGAIGLMTAAGRFEPERGLAFSTFAVPRIRGAILDGLRRVDHAPRSIRRKQRAIAEARVTLHDELGRRPRCEEMAERLGIPLETFWRWEQETQGSVLVSLERPVRGEHDDDPRPPTDWLVDPQPAIDDEIVRALVAKRVRDAVETLNPREQMIMELYYWQDRTLAEIATVLGVTESRVSQIRGNAIGRLKKRLAKGEP